MVQVLVSVESVNELRTIWEPVAFAALESHVITSLMWVCCRRLRQDITIWIPPHQTVITICLYVFILPFLAFIVSQFSFYSCLFITFVTFLALRKKKMANLFSLVSIAPPPASDVLGSDQQRRGLRDIFMYLIYRFQLILQMIFSNTC